MSDTPVLDYNIGRMLRAKFQREDMGCRGKEAFDSVAVARVIAQRVAQRHGESMNVYKCRRCGGIHIGSGRWLQGRGR